jgi:hypothetical protein
VAEEGPLEFRPLGLLEPDPTAPLPSDAAPQHDDGADDAEGADDEPDAGGAP